jgi:YVTN family beta-propeller protein
VTVIDGASDTVITTLVVGSAHGALCYNPQNNKVYFAVGSDTVAVIDGATNQVVKFVVTDSSPQTQCYNPQDDKVYYANSAYNVNGTVTVIDGTSDQVVATVAVGLDPQGLCHNPLDDKVYCANSGSDNVTVIDGVSNQVIATIATGILPFALCYNSQNDKVICSNNGNDVTVIDGASDSVLKTITVGTWPMFMAYNPTQNRVYVAIFDSDSISVIRDSALGVAERSTLVQRRVSLEAFPNPFSGQVRLQLTANGSRPEVRIYDANGALVRDFNPTRSLASSLSRSLVWDGTDNLNRSLPNGIYLVRVSDGSRTVATRELILARE